MSFLSSQTFRRLSALFMLELIAHGLVEKMGIVPWDDRMIDEIKQIMRKIYGNDSFDPRKRDNHDYVTAPEGYGYDDWVVGLRKQD